MIEMVSAIGKILGLGLKNFEYEIVNPVTNRLVRIANHLSLKVGDAGFEADVLRAEQAVDEQGARALMGCLGQVNASPLPKVNKIKCVPKGQRISVVSESGIRFAFGPVWNKAVIEAKGLALNEAHREKLNMHGTTLGVSNPETMAVRELCSAIAGKLEQ